MNRSQVKVNTIEKRIEQFELCGCRNKSDASDTILKIRKNAFVDALALCKVALANFPPKHVAGGATAASEWRTSGKTYIVLIRCVQFTRVKRFSRNSVQSFGGEGPKVLASQCGVGSGFPRGIIWIS